MPTLARISVLWCLLASVLWLLLEKSADRLSDFARFCIAFAVPVMAVWLTCGSSVVLKGGFWNRQKFWLPATLAWLAVALAAEGRYESALRREERLLALIVVFSGAAALWVCATRLRGFSFRKMAGEALISVVAIAASAVGISLAYDWRTDRIAEQAERRWSEIGLPLAEYERAMRPLAENDGTVVLRDVFEELLGAGLYRSTAVPLENAGHAGKSLVLQSSRLIAGGLPSGDEVPLEEVRLEELDRHAEQLSKVYDRILASAAPAWAWEVPESAERNEPNFLALKRFAQVAAADAVRRLAASDFDGAERAVAAGLKSSEGLRDRPGQASFANRLALEALFSQVRARLPASGDGFREIGADVESFRRAVTAVLRHEAWFLLRRSRALAESDFAVRCDGLPVWLRGAVSGRLTERECASGALGLAGHALIHRAPGTERLADLGSYGHERVSSRHRSSYVSDVSRFAIRVHAVLLLREQSEIIRDARYCVAMGQKPRAHDSLVLPGVRWEVIEDVEARSIATRMINRPRWTCRGGVAGPDFWLLPLDGRAGWKLQISRNASLPAKEKTPAARRRLAL